MVSCRAAWATGFATSVAALGLFCAQAAALGTDAVERRPLHRLCSKHMACVPAKKKAFLGAFAALRHFCLLCLSCHMLVDIASLLGDCLRQNLV